MIQSDKQNKKKTILSPDNKSDISIAAKTETAEKQTEERTEIESEEQTEGVVNLDKSVVEKQVEDLKKKEEFSKNSKKDKLDLAKKITVLEESLLEQKDQFMRLAAEFDNYKKRQQQQNIFHLKYAVESMAKNLFKVTDSLENALKHIEQEKDDSRLEEFIAGIKLVQQQFLDVFKQHHIERFQDLGEVFNPERHEAVSTLETEEVKPNQIVEVLTPGYLLHDKVIRAAMVQVSKRKE